MQSLQQALFVVIEMCLATALESSKFRKQKNFEKGLFLFMRWVDFYYDFLENNRTAYTNDEKSGTCEMTVTVHIFTYFSIFKFHTLRICVILKCFLSDQFKVEQ